jgi:hypothetical protein
MQFPDQAAIPPYLADELVATVQAAEPTLRALTDAIAAIRPAPDRWTIKEVIGHLIDSAANNHHRFVRAQLTARLVFPDYKQNAWVDSQNYRDADWQGLVDLWSVYNRHLAHVIRNIPTSALAVDCTIGDDKPVTLHFLMEDYVVHLKHHLKKIAERLHLNPNKLGC